MTDVVLAIDGLIKRFDAAAVLKGISAEVRAGDVIGVLGLNGAGKTTLLETALGFAVPDAGSVRLFGRESSALADEKLKAKIGFVPQQDELLEHMKGSEYLALIGQCYPRWNPSLITRLAAEWSLPMDKRIRTLSVGQRQKLSILSAIGHEPELLILDEPVASLDPVARRQFLQEIVGLAADGQVTVLFSTHIVSDLERIASRVWIMKDGLLDIDENLDALKERCVRVQIASDRLRANELTKLDILHHRDSHGTTTLVISNWSDASSTLLRNEFGDAVVSESLSLEDIFLELHA